MDGKFTDDESEAHSQWEILSLNIMFVEIQSSSLFFRLFLVFSDLQKKKKKQNKNSPAYSSSLNNLTSTAEG